MVYKSYSVLMSVYIKEKPEYLKRSIESILGQTICTDDFVIGKDGPITEELNKLLEEYASKYDYIHIYGYENNHGLGYALNYGINYCINELVARMDSDDISLPDRCEKELNLFHERPSLDIVGTDIYEFTEDEKCISGLKKMPVSQDEIKKYARRRNPFNHPTVMYKKSSVIKYGGYHEGERGEDIALFTKMVFEGCACANIDEPLLKYRAIADQFDRRTSKTDSDAVIRVIKNNYKKGYIGLSDYLYVAVVQAAGRFIPKSIGKTIYKKLFRADYSDKKENKTVDLFIVNTPYHLMMAYSLWKEGDALICVGDFKINSILQNLIHNTFSCRTYRTYDFYYYRKNFAKLLDFRRNVRDLKHEVNRFSFSTIYAFNDVDPVTQWILKNTPSKSGTTLIEEGIGLYRNTTKRHELLFRIAGKTLFGGTYENVRQIGESSCVKKIMCSSPEKLSNTQKCKIIDSMPLIDYEKIAESIGVEPICRTDWFIGQPLIEDGVMLESEYLGGIQQLIEISKKKDRKLVIKPHPREKIEKYTSLGVEIIKNNEIPIELLIDSSDQTYVYTYYSSAVLNLCRMPNINGIVLYKAFNLKESIPDDIFEQSNICMATDITKLI